MPRRRAAVAQSPSLTPYQVHDARLDNGLRVVVCPRAGQSQAYVSVFFGTGSRHEDPRENGITHVLEHMVFRGTKSFADATALNAAAEDFGGYLEGATYRDHVMFATGCHASAVHDAIAILGELVSSPRYQAMEVERDILREELLETVNHDGEAVDIDNIAHAAAFGENGLGMPIEGTIKVLERLQKRDLEAHRARAFVGNNTVVAVAGPVDPREVMASVKKAFGKLPSGARTVTSQAPAPRQKPELRSMHDPGSQVELRLSFRGAPVQDPNYPALVFLARLLADGLSSRMNAELIDKRGLAYALSAGLTTYDDVGLFDFDVAVAPDKLGVATRALLDFAKGAQRFRYREDEIERSLRRYRYGIEFMGDLASDLASFYGRAALFGIEEETRSLYPRLATMTQDELRAAAKRTFRPEGLVLVAVGEVTKPMWREVQRAVSDFCAA